jgi:hypothetical protein
MRLSYRVNVVDETQSTVPGQFLLAADVGQPKCVALLKHLQPNSEHVHRVINEGWLRLKHRISCTQDYTTLPQAKNIVHTGLHNTSTSNHKCIFYTHI